MASCLYPTVHSCNLLPLKHLAQVLLPQMRAAGKGYALARSFLPVAKKFTKRGPLFWCGQNWDFWRSHFACHSYTAVQCTDVLYTSTLVHLETVHLYHQSWRQPGLSRGLESKLILTNESTSNITFMNCITGFDISRDPHSTYKLQSLGLTLYFIYEDKNKKNIFKSIKLKRCWC